MLAPTPPKFLALLITMAALLQLPIATGADRQSYDIPVSVRVVMAKGGTETESAVMAATAPAAAKFTESETYTFLWHIATHPFGRVEVSHRGHRVPATLVTTESSRKALVLSMANFLTLAGLAMPVGGSTEQQTQMVQVPMWSYPAGVQFVASQDTSGYLSFYIVTGGELPAS